MLDKSTISKLKKLIANAETIEALNELSNYLRETEFENEIIALQSRFKNSLSNKRKGLIQSAELNQIKNEVNHAILDIVKEVEPGINEIDSHLKQNFSELIQSHLEYFGGRAKEMSEIDSFLQDKKGGYFYLEGLSGYGKTALISNLININPHFLFHFFTQRYSNSSLFNSISEIDFLKNMIEQLSLFYKLPKQEISDRELRPYFINLVSCPPTKKNLVILLDGVDEIDQNNNFLKGLLPKKIPNEVKIIISARSAGKDENIEIDFFLKNCGLNREDLSGFLELEGLDEKGILFILEKLESIHGEKKIKANFDLAKKIEHVSKGDPFYIRFLLEDLVMKKIDIDNIIGQLNGVEDYLDSQFEMLSKSLHQEYRVHREAIIHIILESPGPIPKKTLSALVNKYIRNINMLDKEVDYHDFENMSWSNFRLIIAPIRRFLFYADGSYTFCHNRFKEYFFKKINMLSK